MERKKENRLLETQFLGLILAVSILFAGLFYEWTSCAVSVLLIVFILIKLFRGKSLEFNINLTSLSVLLTVTFYGLSAFWAVDKGMAFIGFLKFLPVLLFVVCIFVSENFDTFVKNKAPVFIGAIVVLSTGLMQIPALKGYFSVAGRLAGTFQYPNTFAIVVLVAELLTFYADINKCLKAVLIPVLIFGIFYTGSRTVLVLAVIFNIAIIFLKARFKKKALVISLSAFAVTVAVALILAFCGVSPFDRILAINFGASTFVGRVLYFRDALPVILKHPFGLGYLGYFYTQSTFQTGIYSVKYVHNDILQIALDIGWVPAVVFVVSVFKSLFAKSTPAENRLVISVMFLHLLFDFDLQFVGVFMLFVLFLNREGGKTIKITKSNVSFLSSAVILALLSAYFSVALALFTFGQTKVSNNMFPYNTDNQIKMLRQLNRREGSEEVADSIIERNKYIYYAYGEKARIAYKDGDFTALIKYKNLVFDYAPLVYEEYEEYCYMLINGVMLYNNAGDTNSALICQKQLIATKQKYEDNLSKVSKLGLKIKDRLPTRFTDDIEEYISKLT